MTFSRQPVLPFVLLILAVALAACGGRDQAGSDTVGLQNLDPNELLKLSPRQLDDLTAEAQIQFAGPVQAIAPNQWTVANCRVMLAYGTRVEGIAADPAPATPILTPTNPITTGAIVQIDALVTSTGTLVARHIRELAPGPGDPGSRLDAGYHNLLTPPADGQCPIPALLQAGGPGPAGGQTRGGGEQGKGDDKGKDDNKGNDKGKGKGKE